MLFVLCGQVLATITFGVMPKRRVYYNITTGSRLPLIAVLFFSAGYYVPTVGSTRRTACESGKYVNYHVRGTYDHLL
jgi:hypothetical protein